MKNIHVVLIAMFLTIVGLSLCAYKTLVLKLPLLPSEEAEIWSVEARLEFRKSKRGPAKVALSIPHRPVGFVILDENFVSGKYGMSTKLSNENRIVEWAARRVSGMEVLYYHLQLSEDRGGVQFEDQKPAISAPKFPRVPDYPESIKSAVTALLEEVRQKSADTASFTRELLLRFRNDSSDENVRLLKRDMQLKGKYAHTIMYVLAGARIPTRLAHFLDLKEGARHKRLKPWLQAFNGVKWLTFDLHTGEQGVPDNKLLWYTGESKPFTLEGGRKAKLEFSISRFTQEPVMIAERLARKKNSRIMEFSLFSLPVQTQNVYRVLLVVPLGALLIVVLRNVVGIKTFGTFMPVLIALAFRETELLWGIVLFSLLVALGLSIRFYLEYLQLLLVPRLAAVLIIVILLMAATSILSHKLGIQSGLSIALFPMVILAMTIERMSLVWEERGPAEALQQGLGTLLVAALSYLVMSHEVVNHLIFVFPELLLVVLAITVLLGRYTGYRLTELWRFRSMQ